MRVRTSTGVKSMCEAAIVGLVLSISCEFYQVFSPVRFPTMTDVVTNAIGALAGASIWGRHLARSDKKQ